MGKWAHHSFPLHCLPDAHGQRGDYTRQEEAAPFQARKVLSTCCMRSTCSNSMHGASLSSITSSMSSCLVAEHTTYNTEEMAKERHTGIMSKAKKHIRAPPPFSSCPHHFTDHCLLQEKAKEVMQQGRAREEEAAPWQTHTLLGTGQQ